MSIDPCPFNIDSHPPSSIFLLEFRSPWVAFPRFLWSSFLCRLSSLFLVLVKAPHARRPRALCKVFSAVLSDPNSVPTPLPFVVVLFCQISFSPPLTCPLHPTKMILFLLPVPSFPRPLTPVKLDVSLSCPFSVAPFMSCSPTLPPALPWSGLICVAWVNPQLAPSPLLPSPSCRFLSSCPVFFPWPAGCEFSTTRFLPLFFLF